MQRNGRSPARERDHPPAAGQADHASVARIKSSELLGARGELIIEHAQREYRLRRTHSGKLILTA